MTCRELEPLIIERAAGELAPAESAQLDAHLERCERCCAELRAHQETLDLARLPPDDGDAYRLEIATFAAYKRRRRRRVAGFTIGAGFVAAAVAASVVVAPAMLTLRSLPGQRAVAYETSAYADTYADGSSTVVASSDDITAEDAAMAALDEAESP